MFELCRIRRGVTRSLSAVWPTQPLSLKDLSDGSNKTIDVSEPSRRLVLTNPFSFVVEVGLLRSSSLEQVPISRVLALNLSLSDQVSEEECGVIVASRPSVEELHCQSIV